jgi:hypothetical protein
VIGFHSVIERPEPVSRVAPPTTTMTKTSAGHDPEPAADAGMACAGAWSGKGLIRAIVTGLIFGRINAALHKRRAGDR